MRLKRTKEGYYVFASSDDINIQLEASFYWSTSNIKGQALAKPSFASKKLKDVETQTPMHLRDDFPDYVTYFVSFAFQSRLSRFITYLIIIVQILAEDQPDSEQVAGIPDYNDA